MTDPAPSPSDDNSDRSPQIQQNLVGNDNLVIGEMKGGIVIKHLTINDRIPTASLPPSNIVVQNLTQQEYRQRQVLLNKVRDAWVKGVLEKSLHARVSIELGLQERLDLVQQPFSDVAEFAAAPGQALPEGTPATTVFDRLGSGRTLLIVGEPGSGKTIALLKLAEDAIDRTEPDLRQQIPVVFNLSSWARKPQSIEQWLIQELLEKYQVSKALGKTWVESEALMLLLDGLDEVKAEQRNACVQALNQFMQTHGTTEIVICCRIGDYQMLQDRLILRSAICLQPLTATQIDLYFEQAGDRLSALKAVLPQDAELQELAKSPLMLSVMSLAYQDFTLEQLTVSGKIENYRQRLFATYIDRMFQRRGTTQQYSREETQRWLIWLAQKMTDKAQTIFLIEQLQFSWLPTNGQQVQYRLGSGFACSVIGILSSGLVYWPNVKLVDGMFTIIVLGLMNGIYIAFSPSIQPFETLKWSWKEAKINFFRGLFTSLISGLICGLIFRLFSGRNNELIFAMASGLSFGLLSGLVNGFRGSEIQQREKPNQGIFSSLKNAAIIGINILFAGILIFEMISGITSRPLFGTGLGLTFGLINGLIFGLIFGGNACLQHFVLRLVLYHNHHSPWNYTRFLDYTTERLFLQKVGGGYIFVHRMLLEHFAEMSIEQEKR